ncbi:Fumarate hydratase class II [uncultured archaeon]|nr:Fumarate hydratase class II [uncultured archaeon]
MPKTLWSGRFQKDLAKNALFYTESLSVDAEMIEEDIWGSCAHAIMLARQGIITDDDLQRILEWLMKAQKDYKRGKFILKTDLEDVHMNVEKYIIDGAGSEYGGKLHTARSRNDQVVTDARLYIRNRLLTIQEQVIELSKTFLAIADSHLTTPMPGYTHTQDAQPITLAYWATAYVSIFLRDIERVEHSYRLVNTNPLGSCALAGTTFPIDRRLTTKLLGFNSMHAHSLDAISSRDFISEPLSALAIHMSHLSKLAEELVYWSTYEFNLITLDDSYTAGSSIMPQKKNPCVAELARGRTGAVYGDLVQILTTLKGIPMGYNRDLQEDKPPLWNALNTVEATLSVMNGMMQTVTFNEARMMELAGANFTAATELANYLVWEKKVSFRDSHHIVGGLILKLISEKKDFSSFDDIEKHLSKSGVNIPFDVLRHLLDPRNVVEAYRSEGSTSPTAVKKMADDFRSKLKKHEGRIKKERLHIASSRGKTQKLVDQVLLGKPVKSLRI